MGRLDDRTRPSHRDLDGERIKLGQTFGNGCRWPCDPMGPANEVWNCFIGETRAVPLGGIERSYRRFYDGPAVTVKTASGVEFTCTPNHPILTSEGWVSAGLLHNGDDLFLADLGNTARRLGVEPDVEHVGTCLDAVHELASMLACERASGLTVHFHEDVPARNVDVVTEERVLRVNLETLCLEPVDENVLEHADALAPGDGVLVVSGGAPMHAPDGVMSRLGEPSALLGGSVRHSLIHSLRAVPGRDSRALEPIGDGVATDAELFCESLDALSAVVKLDKVVDVEVKTIAEHVYNLQTESGAYLVSGSDNGNVFVASHNCRCRADGEVVGFDGKRGDWADEGPGERWARLPEGMTYEQWKAGKAVSRAESYKNPAGRVSGGWYAGRAAGGARGAAYATPERIAELESIAKGYDDEVERLSRQGAWIPSEESYKDIQALVDKYAAQMDENRWASGFDIDVLKAESDRLYGEQDDVWAMYKAKKAEARAIDGIDAESTAMHDMLLDEAARLKKEYESYFGKVDDIDRKIDAARAYKRAERNYRDYSEELERRVAEREAKLAEKAEADRLLAEARLNRNRAYGELSDAQPFAPHVRSTLGDGYAEALERMVAEAEAEHPEIAGLFRRFSSQLRIADHENRSGAYYLSRDRGIHINAEKVARGDDLHAPYQTVFHEFGHLIDHVGGYGRRGYASKFNELTDAIKKDWTKYRNAEGKRLGIARNKNKVAIDALLEKGARDDMLRYGSVSDIIEGCTGSSYPLGVGHGAAYHKTAGKTATEFFAEVCDGAMANEASYLEMKRIFPNAVKMVEDMAREMCG